MTVSFWWSEVVLMGASGSKVLPPLSAPTREALEQLPDFARHELVDAYDAEVAAGATPAAATTVTAAFRFEGFDVGRHDGG